MRNSTKRIVYKIDAVAEKYKHIEILKIIQLISSKLFNNKKNNNNSYHF